MRNVVELGVRVETKVDLSLSAETPVYDKLGIRAMHEACLDYLTEHPDGNVYLFILGPVGAGKELLAESIFWRLENDERIKRRVGIVEQKSGESIKHRYLSTPMCNAEGKRRGWITSAIGNFNREEVRASNNIMSEYLRSEEGPALNVVETVVFGYPYLDFGVDPFLEVLERSKDDPKILVKIFWSIPTRKLQEQAMATREIIAFAKSDQEAQAGIEQHNVKFDIPIVGNREEIVGSWGNRRAMERVNLAGNWDAVGRQESIRTHFPGWIPQNITVAKLESNPKLWEKVHLARAAFLLDQFGVSSNDRSIVLNDVIPEREIPFYRGLGKKYAALNMSA